MPLQLESWSTSFADFENYKQFFIDFAHMDTMVKWTEAGVAAIEPSPEMCRCCFS